MAYVKAQTSKSCSRALNYGLHKDGEKREFVVAEGINCDPDTAKAQMAMTRKLWGKNDGIQAHILIQSFPPEVKEKMTAIEVNQVGIETGKKLLKKLGKEHHEAVVFTHTDSDGGCLHNHIVINSVDPSTGEKLNMHNKLGECRQLSDEICKSHGLDVIKEKQSIKYTQAERGLIERGKESWKDEIRKAVDKNAVISRDFDDFQKKMRKDNINVYQRGKNITYEIAGTKNKVRGYRLGSDYDVDRIRNLSKEYNRNAKIELHCNWDSVKKSYPNVNITKAMQEYSRFDKQIKNMAILSPETRNLLNKAQWVVANGVPKPIKLTAQAMKSIGKAVGVIPIVGTPLKMILSAPSEAVSALDKTADVAKRVEKGETSPAEALKNFLKDARNSSSGPGASASKGGISVTEIASSFDKAAMDNLFLELEAANELDRKLLVQELAMGKSFGRSL